LKQTIRLNKLLATRGVAARRKCDELIESGVVRVNGEVVTAPGARVIEGRDAITVNGKPIAGSVTHRYLMLHKPVGVITTLSDPEGRRTIRDMLPPGGRLFPVGRLDADTSGLLIVTNDGDLAHHLMHPRYGLTKFYRVLLERAPDEGQLKRLATGVEFEPGVRSAPARVRLRDPIPRGAVIEIALHEGRHRQVRRMCEAVGLTVLGLHRWAYGPLRLGEVARGVFRELSEAEVAALRAASARPQPMRTGRGADGARVPMTRGERDSRYSGRQSAPIAREPARTPRDASRATRDASRVPREGGARGRAPREDAPRSSTPRPGRPERSGFGAPRARVSRGVASAFGAPPPRGSRPARPRAGSPASAPGRAGARPRAGRFGYRPQAPRRGAARSAGRGEIERPGSPRVEQRSSRSRTGGPRPGPRRGGVRPIAPRFGPGSERARFGPREGDARPVSRRPASGNRERGPRPRSGAGDSRGPREREFRPGAERSGRAPLGGRTTRSERNLPAGATPRAPRRPADRSKPSGRTQTGRPGGRRRY
jgi:23S rRNA pseudouridine2605 synthase